jgi:cullin-associated NEDD8-dissociated protein 1
MKSHQIALEPYLSTFKDLLLKNDVRKKTVELIVEVSVYLDEKLFKELETFLINHLRLKSGDTASFMGCLVQSIERNLEKTKVLGFNKVLTELVSLLLQFTKHEDLLEQTLMCLKTCVDFGVISFDESEPIITKSLEMLEYDPHFNDESDIEDDQSEISGFSDADEDESFKVRKQAAKVLQSVTEAYPQNIVRIYDLIGLKLVKIFNDRSVQVRVDVLNSFLVLVEGLGKVVLETDTRKKRRIGRGIYF